MSLEAYLSRSSLTRRQVFSILTARAAQLADRTGDISEFVFVPGRPHPNWEDSEEVFWQATEQLMLANPAGDDELPIIWVGYHAADRLTRAREAQGFLLTDRRLIVKDGVDLPFSKAVERQYPLYKGPNGVAGSAAALVTSAIENYDWAFAGSLIDEDDAEWIAQLLVAVTTETLQALESLSVTLAPQPETSTDFRGRVNELGLGAEVKYPDDPKQAKHFAKLMKKMPLDNGEETIAALTSSTLMGVYGLMFTDHNLRSRDLLEAAVRTSRIQIDPLAVRVSPDSKYKIIVAPGEVHDIPNHLAENKVAALVTLIQEWATQRVN